MVRRILVPLDGSKLAEGVLPYVEDLATRLQAQVYFIQAVGMQPDMIAKLPLAAALISPEFLSEDLEAESKAAEGYLSSLASEWQAKGIDAKWDTVPEVVGRAPAKSIVAFARSLDVDLIAMSTHGRSGLRRLVLGGVADQVVADAGMAVLLVKPV